MIYKGKDVKEIFAIFQEPLEFACLNDQIGTISKFPWCSMSRFRQISKVLQLRLPVNKAWRLADSLTQHDSPKLHQAYLILVKERGSG